MINPDDAATPRVRKGNPVAGSEFLLYPHPPGLTPDSSAD